MPSDATPRLGLPDLPDTPELYAETVADAFWRLDALCDLCLKGHFVNTPPASPSDGDCYLTGGAPTGAWSGYAYKIAACRDGGWQMLTPFDGLRAWVVGSGCFLVYQGGTWTDWNALISAAEGSIASGTTCDIGAAGSLFLAVTGTTTITSFGTAANRQRFLRFAGALTLTHNATSLVLPGGVNIVTAAGDCALFASDASGNWRCRQYQRASGLPLSLASPTVTGTLTAAAANFSGMIGATAIDFGTTTGAQELLLYHNSNAKSGCGIATNEHRSFVPSGGSYFTWGAVSTADGSSFSESMRYLPGGSLSVGTTANAGAGAVCATRLYAGGALSLGVVSHMAAVTFAGSATNGLVMEDTEAGAGTDVPVVLRRNGSVVGTITTTASSAAFNNVSDARLKTVAPVQADYRGAIRALWVGDFTWKESGAPGFGVLAQQAFEVMPNRQGVTRPVDEEGPWQAAAEPFAHLALWGVKDLYTMVEALGHRVAALEAAHEMG